MTARDLLVTRFAGGAIDARGRSALLFGDGESTISDALLYLNGVRQLRSGVADAVEFSDRDPKLHDVRYFANPDSRPKVGSPALDEGGVGYVGAFGKTENWLEEWTLFGKESDYDTRETNDADGQP